MLSNLKSSFQHSSRGLISLIPLNSKRFFSIYTNETLKSAFNAKLKEKYIRKDPEQQEAEGIGEFAKQHMRYMMTNLEDEESVLQSYKKQVVRDDFDTMNSNQQQAVLERLNFIKHAEAHFRTANEEEFMQRSKNLFDSMRLRADWSPFTHEKISSEYLNYNHMEKNYMKMQDKAADPLDKGTYSLRKGMAKVLEGLGPEMLDNKKEKEKIDKMTAKEKYPGHTARVLARRRKMQDIDLRKLVPKYPKLRRPNFGERRRKKERPRIFFGRISPHCREQIYSLYKNGESIRDLSIKFGLLPERLKVIIWMRQLFYEEIMPRIDLTTMKLGLELEMISARRRPFIDYGSDLIYMIHRDRGIPFHRFRRTEVDIKQLKEVEDKMEKVLEKQSKKKYDLVTEKFVGEGTKGYFIKDWVVYKGHGSNRVNKKFKAILHNYKTPQNLPHDILTKLHKGPRAATRGYGIK